MGQEKRAGSRHFAALALWSALLLTPSSGTADESKIDCLLSAGNKQLSWNAAWQPDGLDDGARYFISHTEERTTPHSRHALLQLEAIAGAQKPSRYIVVKNEKTARALCANISEVDPALLDPGEREAVKKRQLAEAVQSRHAAEQEAADDTPLHALPFIQYGPKGWVRGDPPARKAMTVCEVLGKRFLCLDDEKQRFGAQLQEVAEELKVAPPAAMSQP